MLFSNQMLLHLIFFFFLRYFIFKKTLFEKLQHLANCFGNFSHFFSQCHHIRRGRCVPQTPSRFLRQHANGELAEIIETN